MFVCVLKNKKYIHPSYLLFSFTFFRFSLFTFFLKKILGINFEYVCLYVVCLCVLKKKIIYIHDTYFHLHVFSFIKMEHVLFEEEILKWTEIFAEKNQNRTVFSYVNKTRIKMFDFDFLHKTLDFCSILIPSTKL